MNTPKDLVRSLFGWVVVIARKWIENQNEDMHPNTNTMSTTINFLSVVSFVLEKIPATCWGVILSRKAIVIVTIKS